MALSYVQGNQPILIEFQQSAYTLFYLPEFLYFSDLSCLSDYILRLHSREVRQMIRINLDLLPFTDHHAEAHQPVQPVVRARSRLQPQMREELNIILSDYSVPGPGRYSRWARMYR